MKPCNTARCRGKALAARLSLAFVFALGGAAHAQDRWPEKSITVIVPFAPGGGTDIIGRLVAGPLAKALGRSVLIENRGGAGGNIGMGMVARAPADGYTLLMTSSAYFVNPALYKSVPYDPERDFAPISELAAAPDMFVAHPKANINSIPDLVAYAKANPGKLNYASAGAGTSPHLMGELLKLREKIGIEHVAYGGAGPAITAVLSGQPEIGAFFLPPLQPHVKAGTVRALAVASSQRWYNMPEVPTMIELGYADFISETVILFAAPVKTPTAIVQRLEQETLRALQTPEVKQRAEELGYRILGRGAAALGARTTKDVGFYKKLVVDAKILPQ
jgi:tripartite-type tricarboxylate transporter receptor subunit TctC